MVVVEMSRGGSSAKISIMLRYTKLREYGRWSGPFLKPLCGNLQFAANSGEDEDQKVLHRMAVFSNISAASSGASLS